MKRRVAAKGRGGQQGPRPLFFPHPFGHATKETRAGSGADGNDGCVKLCQLLLRRCDRLVFSQLVAGTTDAKGRGGKRVPQRVGETAEVKASVFDGTVGGKDASGLLCRYYRSRRG